MRMLIKASRRLRRFKRDEGGTQLVELALVMTLMLTLFGAVAEFGRYFYEYQTLAKASRVGARYLATAPVNATEDAIAKNLVIYGNTSGTGTPVVSGLSTTQVVITRAGGVPILPQTVTVKIVGYKHQTIFDLGKLTNNASLSLNIDVKPSVTMRYLLTQPPI
jgi:Flp pilus assembly protein TadG